MLSSHPFHSSVSNCDIFTRNLEDYCKNADILVSACGVSHLIKPENIKNGVVLIDVGINQIKNSNNKQRIVGDICPSSYEKSSFYTTVPGGVGLLTLSTLAFNVLNACLLQKGIRQVNLFDEMYKKENFNKFIETKKINDTIKTNKIYQVLVLSSAYNGLTQNIEKILKGMGHKVDFSLAKTDDQMRVKGDRGPSSLDWAILKNLPEWGVAILEADKEMDAGNIWAISNFRMPYNITKGELYNSLISRTATKLIVECFSKLDDPNFRPEPLDYSKPDVKGNLHKTLKNNIEIIPESEVSNLSAPDLENTYQEISFRKHSKAGILFFNFYNGAMDTRKCKRLVEAIKECSKQDINVLVFADQAQEAWNNIKEINNVVKEILFMKNLITISAIQTNAGAGGVYMALASDFVFAQDDIVLNPHYKNMGLYGSELHTITAPKRIGKSALDYLKNSAIPLLTKEAIELNLIDDIDKKFETIFNENVQLLDMNLDFLDKIKLFASKYSNDEQKLKKYLNIKQEIFRTIKFQNVVLEQEETELNEMKIDMFMNRNDFDRKRKAFLRKVDIDEV
ncbi:unnamed protein product [Brachionus calyciflorus]|uniref:Tetrahydrofolate dehydrogenase/cyclohydrolase NAD(P)-binding domain-containing protein n=1 Tax=Brachionus calyciflorus TaxID=104777 RepID=A0A813XW33_9BILA|nr:unnamed protein product [Brachionus calyciflorus]